MKFLILILFFLSQSSFARSIYFEKLIQTRSEGRNVRVSSIKAQEQVHYICDEFEENEQDQPCIKGHNYCTLRLTFPSHNLLGQPETYEIRNNVTLLDFRINVEDNCKKEFLKWQSINANKTITYLYNENLYRINYQDNLKKCFQVPHAKIHTSLRIYPLDWFFESKDNLLGENPKYKVLCEILDKQ
jgi:hypothetical protein